MLKLKLWLPPPPIQAAMPKPTTPTTTFATKFAKAFAKTTKKKKKTAFDGLKKFAIIALLKQKNGRMMKTLQMLT